MGIRIIWKSTNKEWRLHISSYLDWYTSSLVLLVPGNTPTLIARLGWQSVMVQKLKLGNLPNFNIEYRVGDSFLAAL